MTVPGILNRKRKITLLRYKDSGTSMVWLEGGGDKSPCIAIDLLTSIDINAVSAEVAKEKSKENEGKFRFLKKRLATQAFAEYAFTVWHEVEGTKLDKRALKSHLRGFKWSPEPRVLGRYFVHVISTTDYHGDLIVEENHLGHNEIYVHAVRFGTNEKILLKGWTTGKYIRLVGLAKTQKLTARKSGRDFTITKYHVEPEELFPMSLLRDQLAKGEGRGMTKEEVDEMEEKKGETDEFGF